MNYENFFIRLFALEAVLREGEGFFGSMEGS